MATEAQFTETALLMAVMNEDWDEALRLAEDMLPGERSSLRGDLDLARQILLDPHRMHARLASGADHG